MNDRFWRKAASRPDDVQPSANITDLDPVFADMPIARKRIDGVKIPAVLSNSLGFGGTNASLVFRHPDA